MMLEILLTFFLVLLGIVILALLLPLRIIFRGTGSTDTGFDGIGRVMFFAGLLGGGGEFHGTDIRAGLYIGSRRIYTIDTARFSRRGKKKTAVKETEREKEKEKEKEQDRESSTEERSERKKAGLAERVRHSLRLGQAYGRFAKTVLHKVQSLFRVDRFDTQVTLGLDDPARTGQVMGILYAINGVLPEHFVIRPGCDFTRRVFSGGADIRVTFRTWLFWIHLIGTLWLYRKLRRQTKPVYRENFEAQEA
jgi:hypothetical protein